MIATNISSIWCPFLEKLILNCVKILNSYIFASKCDFVDLWYFTLSRLKYKRFKPSGCEDIEHLCLCQNLSFSKVKGLLLNILKSEFFKISPHLQTYKFRNKIIILKILPIPLKVINYPEAEFKEFKFKPRLKYSST